MVIFKIPDFVFQATALIVIDVEVLITILQCVGTKTRFVANAGSLGTKQKFVTVLINNARANRFIMHLSIRELNNTTLSTNLSLNQKQIILKKLLIY